MAVLLDVSYCPFQESCIWLEVTLFCGIWSHLSCSFEYFLDLEIYNVKVISPN